METGIIGLVIIVSNVLFSYKGFKDRQFFERYEFNVEKILVYKQYDRLLSSGFLHVSWSHLLLNMLSLYLFDQMLESAIGPLKVVLVYFTGLLAGDLLSLFIHRHHSDYSAVGASGAVSGIVFASIALFPGLKVGLMFIPFHVQSWIFGLLFVVYSIYGIKSKTDNIGHDAHLGGALAGMLVALLLFPDAFGENYFAILIITVPSLVFILFIIKNPQYLLIDSYFSKTHRYQGNVDQKFNENKVNKQKELDKILDKISRSGVDSLSAKEKKRLEDYSK